MIEAKSLTMHYGSFAALKAVSFEAKSNQILGLLGPNGAGKTTTMRILTTFLHPSSGTADIYGVDISKEPKAVRRMIGYLPEVAPLYPEMLVDEYLKFIGSARGITGAVLRRQLDFVTESCGIAPVWKHAIGETSKGFRQRIGLAQALIHDPKVLIMDEPTSGLDPLQIIEIRKLIRDLAKNKTVIFSSHVLHEVENMADRIVILHEGSAVVEGTLTELHKVANQYEEMPKRPNLESIFIAMLRSGIKSKGVSS